MSVRESSPSDNDQWGDCPRGELVGFSHQARSHQQRHLLAKSIPVAAVVVLAVAGWTLLKNDTTQVPDRAPGLNAVANIKCTDCLNLMDSYFAMTLTKEQLLAVHDHIGVCRHCKQKYRDHSEELGVPMLISNACPLPDCEVAPCPERSNDALVRIPPLLASAD